MKLVNNYLCLESLRSIYLLGLFCGSVGHLSVSHTFGTGFGQCVMLAMLCGYGLCTMFSISERKRTQGKHKQFSWCLQICNGMVSGVKFYMIRFFVCRSSKDSTSWPCGHAHIRQFELPYKYVWHPKWCGNIYLQGSRLALWWIVRWWLGALLPLGCRCCTTVFVSLVFLVVGLTGP